MRVLITFFVAIGMSFSVQGSDTDAASAVAATTTATAIATAATSAEGSAAACDIPANVVSAAASCADAVHTMDEETARDLTAAINKRVLAVMQNAAYRKEYLAMNCELKLSDFERSFIALLMFEASQGEQNKGLYACRVSYAPSLANIRMDNPLLERDRDPRSPFCLRERYPVVDDKDTPPSFIFGSTGLQTGLGVKRVCHPVRSGLSTLRSDDASQRAFMCALASANSETIVETLRGLRLSVLTLYHPVIFDGERAALGIVFTPFFEAVLPPVMPALTCMEAGTGGRRPKRELIECLPELYGRMTSTAPEMLTRVVLDRETSESFTGDLRIQYSHTHPWRIRLENKEVTLPYAWTKANYADAVCIHREENKNRRLSHVPGEIFIATTIESQSFSACSKTTRSEGAFVRSSRIYLQAADVTFDNTLLLLPDGERSVEPFTITTFESEGSDGRLTHPESGGLHTIEIYPAPQRTHHHFQNFGIDAVYNVCELNGSVNTRDVDFTISNAARVVLYFKNLPPKPEDTAS